MQNRQRQVLRFMYHVRHQYVTMNNVVLAVAAVIAVSWAWASVQAVQRNYQLQGEVDDKKRQQRLVALQTENLQFEQRYYKSREYIALEAKRRLGLAEPGEKVLILQPNTDLAKSQSAAEDVSTVSPSDAPSPAPFQQWMAFLFGSAESADK